MFILTTMSPISEKREGYAVGSVFLFVCQHHNSKRRILVKFTVNNLQNRNERAINFMILIIFLILIATDPDHCIAMLGVAASLS